MKYLFMIYRYSFTVFANILVYVITWIVLRSSNENKNQFGPKEKKEFQVYTFLYILKMYTNL